MSYDHQLKLDEIFNPEAECIDDLDERIFLFVEGCFELAFGDNAINRDFTPQQVLEKLRTFSDQSPTTQYKMPDWYTEDGHIPTELQEQMMAVLNNPVAPRYPLSTVDSLSRIPFIHPRKWEDDDHETD